MLLRGQEAASNPAWESAGNTSPVAEKHSAGRSLRREKPALGAQGAWAGQAHRLVWEAEPDMPAEAL